MFFLFCLGWVVAATAAPGKPVRLRNALAAPETTLHVQSSTLASPATSGLFILQFREPLRPGWREQLTALGVDLLRYVPEDAFVAKFTSVRVAQIRALGFVQFLGDYRASQKVHRAFLRRRRIEAGGELSARRDSRRQIARTQARESAPRWRW